MPIAVSGSIATDHLMHFPGKFTDSLLPDQLHRVSLSFLVDDLVVRRGGVAPNICFGMALLGLRPILVGAAGADFADYESWLTRHGVDCTKVHLCADVQTARFVCTTDDEMNQIASFYAGAMARSREIEIEPIARAYGGLDLVVIAADDPEGMVRHSEECRERGYTFAADPSQQLARMDGPDVISLITGAERAAHQRLRAEPAAVQDRLERGQGAAGRRLPGDHPRFEGRRDRRRRRQPADRRCAAGEVEGRPDRRRRCLPGRLPGRQRLRACRWNARRSWAR